MVRRNVQKTKVRKINRMSLVETKEYINRLVEAGGITSKACICANVHLSRLQHK